MTSAILQRGPEHIRTIQDEMTAWMEEREYESLHQMWGSMSLLRCPNPKAYERANYMHTLDSWKELVDRMR